MTSKKRFTSSTPVGEYGPRKPTLSARVAGVTTAAMAAAAGDRGTAAKALGINENALKNRLSWLRRKTDLDFPDTSYTKPGSTQEETVLAMREAKGDRKQAAKRLGITLFTLSARLCIIRNMQEALEDEQQS